MCCGHLLHAFGIPIQFVGKAITAESLTIRKAEHHYKRVGQKFTYGKSITAEALTIRKAEHHFKRVGQKFTYGQMQKMSYKRI
ncbi:hypothetical protein H5410_054112 [Solanum commersonii]|uniref:Uncharacterized protein n=1 Tax=Solanum commersonii TaxID=4109 RepID=A0A9J5X7P1_SOLCO|nr:hypothetical protein H5410_054112 [Solanum commersonii]